MQDLVKEQEFLDNRGASTRAVLDCNHLLRRKKLHKNISDDQKGSIYERNAGKPGLSSKVWCVMQAQLRRGPGVC